VKSESLKAKLNLSDPDLDPWSWPRYFTTDQCPSILASNLCTEFCHTLQRPHHFDITMSSNTQTHTQNASIFYCFTSGI